MPRTLWNRDVGPTFLEQNSYSSHPFVLALEQGVQGVGGSGGRARVRQGKSAVSLAWRSGWQLTGACCLRPTADGSAWGVLLLNSNAMDIVPTEEKLRWAFGSAAADESGGQASTAPTLPVGMGVCAEASVVVHCPPCLSLLQLEGDRGRAGSLHPDGAHAPGWCAVPRCVCQLLRGCSMPWPGTAPLALCACSAAPATSRLGKSHHPPPAHACLPRPLPPAVLDQLTQVVGRPAMVPRWALGWHQSKYGYQSVWEVQEVVANYSAAGLPLEALWTDIGAPRLVYVAQFMLRSASPARF